MLLSRLIRTPKSFSYICMIKVRPYSGGHGHEPIMDEIDGVNRRINPVVRHEIDWENVHFTESHTYRNPKWDTGEVKDFDYYAAKLLSGFAWAWFIYHMYYEGHELFAKHYPTPDVTRWSDEYLGIPPDDQGLAPEKKWVRTADIPWGTVSLMLWPKCNVRRAFNGDEGPYKF